jgi:hypothetical protein
MVHLNLIIILVVSNYVHGTNMRILKDIVIGVILVVIHVLGLRSFNVLIAIKEVISIVVPAINTIVQAPPLLSIMIIEYVIHASMDAKFVRPLIIVQFALVECFYSKAGAILNVQKILNLI